MNAKAIQTLLLILAPLVVVTATTCPADHFSNPANNTQCVACFNCSSRNAVLTGNCTNTSDAQCDCAPGHINTGLYGVCPGLIFDPEAEKELVGCDGCISLYGQDLSVSSTTNGVIRLTANFSIAFWLYVPTAQEANTNGVPVFQMVATALGLQHQIAFFVNSPEFENRDVLSIRKDSQWLHIIGTNTSQGGWHHYVISTAYNRPSVIYKNGVQTTSNTVTPSPLDATEILYDWNTGYNGFFEPAATMADLRLLSRPLQPTEAYSLFKGDAFYVEDTLRTSTTVHCDFTLVFFAWIPPRESLPFIPLFEWTATSGSAKIMFYANMEEGGGTDALFIRSADGNTTSVTRGTATATEDWHYYTITVRHNGTATIYKNGVDVTTSAQTVDLPQTELTYHYSRGVNGQGINDNVGYTFLSFVYDRILTATEIADVRFFTMPPDSTPSPIISAFECTPWVKWRQRDTCAACAGGAYLAADGRCLDCPRGLWSPAGAHSVDECCVWDTETNACYSPTDPFVSTTAAYTNATEENTNNVTTTPAPDIQFTQENGDEFDDTESSATDLSASRLLPLALAIVGLAAL